MELSGRRGEARRNDARILEAAREVFVADPDARVAAVAERAGVGIGAVYRRYASKEELLRKLCWDGLLLYTEIAREAVEDDDPDAWRVFSTFMHRVADADTHAMTTNLAGRFTPTDEMFEEAGVAWELNHKIVDRAHAAGVLRKDFGAADMAHVFEELTNLYASTPERKAELRARYLAIHLDGMRAPGTTPLPGPPPKDEEHAERWVPRGS